MDTAQFLRTSGKVKLTATMETEVELSASDIERWIDTVKDPEVLRCLARYASYCATSLEHQDDDDDFRSRA